MTTVRAQGQAKRQRHGAGAAMRMWVLAAACAACGAAGAAGTWNGRQPDRIFQRLDFNGDGVVDKSELESARRAAFASADSDHDGYITETEAQSLLQALRVQGAAGQRPLYRGRLAGRQAAEQANVIARFDVNGDGRVSEAEFVDLEHPFGARFDGDGDGRITKLELEQASASLRDGQKRAAR
jgi:Ca2+-binding EF-hand superfamily protein